MPDSVSPFDPYIHWLGIRDPERPPNHYRLLGLEPFEDDADVIANAADRQMAHVRRFQNGPRSELSQQLLNELAAAKVCLLRPELKGEYDHRLRTVLAGQFPMFVTPRPRELGRRQRSRDRQRRYGILVLVVVFVAIVGTVAWTLRAPSRVRPQDVASDNVVPTLDPHDGQTHREPSGVDTPRSHAAPPQLDVGAAGRRAAVGRQRAADPSAGGLAETTFDRAPESLSPRLPVEPARETADVDASPSTPASDDALEGWFPETEPDAVVERPPPAGTSESLAALSPMAKSASLERYRRTGERRSVSAGIAEPPVVPPSPEVALTGGQQAERATEGTFARLRQALRSREMEVATELVERLSEEAASFTQRDAADRLRALVYQLDRFWDAVASGSRVLQPGQEFRVNQQPVSIVRVDRRALVIRDAGGKDEAIALEPREMPASWAIMLASLDFARRGGTAEPLVAAFLSVDREGDAKLADELWRDLRRRGCATPLPSRDDP